jgi:hypothetical protein
MSFDGNQERTATYPNPRERVTYYFVHQSWAVMPSNWNASI